MKLCTIGYVPPPNFGQPQVFLDNIRRFRITHDLILLSDHDWPGITGKVPGPEVARKHIKDQHEQRFAINNFIFLLCLKHVIQQRYTHMLYIESDSRVGADDWDDTMFSEFFADPRPLVAGGSMVIYNGMNGGPEGAHRFSEVVAQYNTRRNYPVVGYQGPMVKAFGCKGAADDTGSCVFPNGSLSIFSVEWLRQLLPGGDIMETALTMTAWDMQIGHFAWLKYGAQVYDLIGHLTCMYSSYGNVLTTEKERLEMVRSGKILATHQVKGGGTI